MTAESKYRIFFCLRHYVNYFAATDKRYDDLYFSSPNQVVPATIRPRDESPPAWS